MSSCLLTLRQPPALDVFARDDAEILQNELQQILFRQERVQHQRRKRVPVDLFEQRAAKRRLAGADVAGNDHEPFATPDGVLQQLERVRVRLALEEKFRIRCQAERLFREPVIVLVHVCLRLIRVSNVALAAPPAADSVRGRHNRRRQQNDEIGLAAACRLAAEEPADAGQIAEQRHLPLFGAAAARPSIRQSRSFRSRARAPACPLRAR